MFHFGSPAGRPVYGVIFDIGSGSVGAAIVESRHDRSLPTLIYSTRSTLRVGKDEQDSRRVREALLATALTLSQEGLAILKQVEPRAKISRVLATVGSPWSHTAARSVTYENDEPFTINHALLSDLAESAESEILTQIRSEIDRLPQSSEIVERATTDITINDYVVENPAGKKGTVCGLSHMVGLVPSEILSGINEVHAKLFPNTELKVHTYLLALYCVLRDIYPHIHNFTVIDVTGEATELGIVENSLLTENLCIDYGSNTLVRGVMQDTGNPASDIETLIAAESNNHLMQRDDLKNQIEKYATTMQEALAELLKHRTPSHNTIVTARYPYRQLFTDIIRKTLHEATTKQPHILELEHNLLHEVAAGSSHDPHTALLARFFHKLHGCGELTDA